MKIRISKLLLIFILAVPTIGFADWGKEPEFTELSRYSEISIGFASQDLKTPVSTFGHTFLVFHNSDPPEANSLVVEFTGKAPGILDNISALFASVPGKYSLSYLAERMREYDYENRSIWLYKLNLSNDAIANVKQYLAKSENKSFAYDFSQKNCAYYIAQTLSNSTGHLEYKRDGLFITPVSTLRWARSEGIISSGIFLPSTQLRALHEYETLSEADKERIFTTLSEFRVPNPNNTSIEISRALSAITEYLIPRESDSNKRNYLFVIKRDFPSDSNSGAIKADDPSQTVGPNSISMLFLPNRNASIVTFSPGFIRLANEKSSSQHNSTIEALTTDIYTDHAGYARLDQFHLVRIESNQPNGYLRDGFTQALDISYTNYRAYLDKNYKEAKVQFGRGISWLYFGSTVSLVPLASVIESWQDSGAKASGRLEIRFRDYKQITQNISTAVQVDQTVNQNSAIRQEMNLDLVDAISKAVSVSFSLHRVKGEQQSSTLSGIKITASF